MKFFFKKVAFLEDFLRDKIIEVFSVFGACIVSLFDSISVHCFWHYITIDLVNIALYLIVSWLHYKCIIYMFYLRNKKKKLKKFNLKSCVNSCKLKYCFCCIMYINYLFDHPICIKIKVLISTKSYFPSYVAVSLRVKVGFFSLYRRLAISDL